MGTTKRPVYRLVVADSRSPRDGRFIEAIGFYDPLPNPAVVRIDEEKVKVWMRRGARPSDSARDLLIREGILAASARPPRGDRPAKKAKAAEPAGAEVTAATAVAEAPPEVADAAAELAAPETEVGEAPAEAAE
ncbi:MAG: 30S ribosomal protein S16 [Candidatus Dormibacteraeota bacterium]|nr:30S ribosomal protein S16 [Candidatus Dormibacteraeota bacterium]